jgi:hypothetical protein
VAEALQTEHITVSGTGTLLMGAKSTDESSNSQQKCAVHAAQHAADMVHALSQA